MNPWLFVAAAYAVVLVGGGLLVLLSWRAMRRAERRVEQMRR